MSKRRDMHFKECLPESTVCTIKDTLSALGIEMQEQWVDKSIVDTYSLRVSVAGTKIGANGKGFTKAYAMASAYAEFMERFQNNLLNKYPRTELNEEGFFYSCDENILTAEQLVLENNAFIEHLFKRRNIDEYDMVEKEKSLMKLHESEYLLTKKEEFVCVPFYSVTEERIVNMPYNIYINMYGSNGMCAGNTEREAIIQGLSEIVERYIQREVLLNNYALPDIPENFIKKYSEIFKRYEKLKKIDGYDFYLKDCSLGGRYPVAALFVVEKNTGRFGVKFGCHPDFGTAMERTITEATQGCEITEYCDRSKLDFLNMGVSNEININNSYKTGYAKYPYQIFNQEADFKFTEVKDVSNISDDKILEYFIDEVIGNEYEILVRDVSYSPLKSFHIIIPGMSEMSSGDDEGFVLISRSRIAEYLINNPQDIDDNGCNVLLYVLLMVSKMQLTCNLTNLSGTLLNEEYFPGEEYHLGWLFMIVMCYVYKGEYEKAYEKMKLFVDICEAAGYDIKAYYKAIAYYLQAVVGNVGCQQQIMQYMRVFFDMDVAEKVEENFANNKLIFIKHYITHDTNVCQSKGCCDFHVFEDLQKKHRQLMKENKIEQISLKKIFS